MSEEALFSSKLILNNASSCSHSITENPIENMPYFNIFRQIKNKSPNVSVSSWLYCKNFKRKARTSDYAKSHPKCSPLFFKWTPMREVTGHDQGLYQQWISLNIITIHGNCPLSSSKWDPWFKGGHGSSFHGIENRHLQKTTSICLNAKTNLSFRRNLKHWVKAVPS